MKKNKKPWANIPLSNNLQQNLTDIRITLGNSPDLVIREIQIGRKGDIQAAFIFIDGMVKSEKIESLLQILMVEVREANLDKGFAASRALTDLIDKTSLPIGDVKTFTKFEALFDGILSGNTVLLIDGYNVGLSADIRGWEKRTVKEPETQTVVRGPREGFTETLRTNTTLIRRKIRDPRLWLENKKIGRYTQTDVCMMYINGIANDKIVQEVRERLDKIDIDGILESGYIEELIEDAPFSIFPTVLYTERPDTAAASLLQGKIAIIVDGSPFILLVPVTFVSFMQAAEDFYTRTFIANLIRLLRYISLFIAALVPSLFVAITTYHQELIPTDLLISLAAQREGNPFPAFVEALLMETVFEILREAGVRMPRVVGSAISIVGALVIGTAAVEAGFVSAAMVIVVSLTAIANFVIPFQELGVAVRILRFMFMFLAASFGFYGVLIGMIAILLHVCSLRSFGVPYMKPFGPFVLSEMKDGILRFPWFAMRTRPRLTSNKNNLVRQQPPRKAKPQPPSKN